MPEACSNATQTFRTLALRPALHRTVASLLAHIYRAGMISGPGLRLHGVLALAHMHSPPVLWLQLDRLLAGLGAPDRCVARQ